MTCNPNPMKDVLAANMKSYRKHQRYSQFEMAEKLQMSVRSYADVERKVSLCSTRTFVHFLLLCSDEQINQLIQELREADSIVT